MPETSKLAVFKEANYDQYWRLHEEWPRTKQDLIEILDDAGYDVKSSANKGELFKLVQKVQIGRLCYDKCILPELKEFAVARGLVEARKKPTKRWLADSLMEADDNRTFDKIFDLPPELRKLVYEFHLSDFAHIALEEPTQPPLARTCRMMRNEVLPLFYSTCHFELRFSTMRTPNKGEVRFRMDRATYIFLTALAPGCIGDLRKLFVVFKDEAIVRESFIFWVGVDLCDRAYPFFIDDDDELDDRDWVRVHRKMEKQLQYILGRDDRTCLTLQDCHHLGLVVERAFARKDKE